MTKWVSVEDELPLAGGDSEGVLIYDGQYIGIGYYEPEEKWTNDEGKYNYRSAVWYSDVGYIKTSIGGFAEVTHWAELPKPPENIQEKKHESNTTNTAR